MKKIKMLLMFFLGFIALVQFSGCKTTAKAKPLSEVLKAVFYAQQVKHDGTVVYVKGGATNTVDNYKKLRIDLSSGTTVSFTDFDGNTFAGFYSLSGNTLTLSGLNPIPTGSGGTILFNVVSFTESPAQIVLSRSGTSVKTGNTSNEYTLTTTP
jgi:hypothetical protein